MSTKEQQARAYCQQANINIIETSSYLRFIGRGVDLTIPRWADLNLRDLAPIKQHFGQPRLAHA